MQALPSSYKDPSGYVFMYNNEVHRIIHFDYQKQFQQLLESGLYEHLVGKQLLIPHEEVSSIPLQSNTYKIIKPRQIPLVNYAYEWSFEMLKDAALCTLDTTLEAISFGMILKDANTFNIQFDRGKPIFIDTLSFELYHEKESWVAYRQFCECFLAPMLLMKYCNLSLNKLLIAYPNGIPIAVCKSMLPFSARFNLHVNLHIFLQNKVSNQKSNHTRPQPDFSKAKMLTLLNGLKSFVGSLECASDKTTWDNYYDETILSTQYLEEKKKLVAHYLKQIEFQTLLDLGANDGVFSMLYKNSTKQIFAVDEDRNCIEKLYQTCKAEGIQNILPLIIDLSAPSPAIGWHNTERDSFFQRVKPDVTLALALIHHLAIGHNISLQQIADFLYSFSKYVIIEFVDKTDPKVIQLLQHRKDIFTQYQIADFKKWMQNKFEILEETQLTQKSRTLFLLKRKEIS
ncbi:MAG: SAM-dependent methyltransferase [Bacteroidetes bacterium]|nr:SAM-dependent methyltransferase [Bacteroidota bacterium]